MVHYSGDEMNNELKVCYSNGDELMNESFIVFSTVTIMNDKQID